MRTQKRTNLGCVCADAAYVDEGVAAAAYLDYYLGSSFDDDDNAFRRTRSDIDVDVRHAFQPLSCLSGADAFEMAAVDCIDRLMMVFDDCVADVCAKTSQLTMSDSKRTDGEGGDDENWIERSETKWPL